MAYKYEKYGRYNKEYADKYRVKSFIKSFRDLEVYQKTIQLSSEITNLPFLTKKAFENEKEEIKTIAEKIPKLIAESYGDKFDSRELARKKLTETVTLITNIITKIDLLRGKFAENKEVKEILDKLLTRYITQKRKVLNLRKAWDRLSERFPNKNEGVRKNDEIEKS